MAIVSYNYEIDSCLPAGADNDISLDTDNKRWSIDWKAANARAMKSHFFACLRSRDIRMNRRLERHRKQVWLRTKMRIQIAILWSILPPIAIALVVTVWRICAYMVVQ